MTKLKNNATKPLECRKLCKSYESKGQQERKRIGNTTKHNFQARIVKFLRLSGKLIDRPEMP